MESIFTTLFNPEHPDFWDAWGTTAGIVVAVGVVVSGIVWIIEKLKKRRKDKDNWSGGGIEVLDTLDDL